jgi:hypothetical protein
MMKSEYFIFHKNYKPLDFRKRLNMKRKTNRGAKCKMHDIFLDEDYDLDL